MSAQVTPGSVSGPAPVLVTRFPMTRVTRESLKDLHDNWGWLTLVTGAVPALCAWPGVGQVGLFAHAWGWRRA